MSHNKLLILLVGVFFGVAAISGVRPGDDAPAFAEKTADGKSVSLDNYKGKYVVLEWTNYGCPFVRKHYDSGNMQKLQAQAIANGDVWLTVCSAAPGKGGQLPAAKFTQAAAKMKAKPTAILLDADGSMGRAFGAKVTPHMIVRSPEGKVIYNGAIDSKASTKARDVASAENYVTAALAAAKSGKPVTTAATKPYGCGIKFAKKK